MQALISSIQAQTIIASQLPKIPAIPCPLTKCAGRILREPVLADRPLPPFNRATMDGYALRAADIASNDCFRIVTQISAGQAAALLGDATASCAEIMTGAVVPDDADCIIPYEETQLDDMGRVRLLNPTAHATGDCIHSFGSDHPADEILLSPGAVIGSREIAIAATCGYAELSVSKIPAISVVSTGDELVDVASQPLPYQIRRSNDFSIETALAQVQLHAKERSHLPDNPTVSIIKLAQLIEANDFIIITGGISMGKKDFIPNALNELQLDCHFHGVAQKPGKPFGFWSNKDCAVFTLPGNPLSTLVAMHQYVIPAIQNAMDRGAVSYQHQAELAAPVKARDDITIFLPVRLEANNQAHSCPAQNSGDLVRVLESDGYIELPPTPDKSYSMGSRFTFHPWL